MDTFPEQRYRMSSICHMSQRTDSGVLDVKSEVPYNKSELRRSCQQL